MRHENTYNFKQQSLYWFVQQETSVESGIIVFIHGLGDHSRRYDEWFQWFVNNNFGVVSLDLPGHGRSTGVRGHIDTYDDYMDIIDFLVSKTEEKFPGVPIILYGHSMGGNLVTSYLQNKSYSSSIKSALVTSPWYSLFSIHEVFITPVTHMLSSLSPRLLFKSKIRLSDLRFLKVLRSKKSDQPDDYAHRWISVRLFSEVQKQAGVIRNSNQKISIPLLIVHGASDRLTKPQSSIAVGRNLGDKCEVILWEGVQHHIHNTEKSKDIFNFIENWIGKRRSAND